MNKELMRMLDDAGFIFTPDVMNKLPQFEQLIQLEREACANKLLNDGWGYAAKTIRARKLNE
jgi:hypothetical protein